MTTRGSAWRSRSTPRWAGMRVVRVLEELKQRRGLPRQIRSDNGPEFVSRAVDQWAYEQGLQWHTIQPGRPMENGYVESFNGRFRDECLNENWFSRSGRRTGEDCTVEARLQRRASAQQLAVPYHRVEFAAQSAASFETAGVGQGASNAGPLPHAPIPATQTGARGRTETGESLIIPGLKMGGRSKLCRGKFGHVYHIALFQAIPRVAKQVIQVMNRNCALGHELSR
jgi:hypothetical protein